MNMMMIMMMLMVIIIQVLLTLASVNGACIGLLYVLFYLVAKQIYDERHHADLLVLGNCFFGVGQTIGTFIEGIVTLIYKNII